MPDEGGNNINMPQKQGVIPSPLRLPIPHRRWIFNLLVFCIAFEVFLVLIDAVVNYGRMIDIGAMRRLCNIAREDGLATWFQVTQTFMAGLTLWAIVLVSKHSGRPKKIVWGWGVLAAFFTFMAADDGAQIHERLGSTFKAVFRSDGGEQAVSWGSRMLEFFPSYPWQFVVLPIFGALGLFMLFFIWHQEDRPRLRKLLVLAVCCFAFAVGLDFIEGLDDDHAWNIYSWLKHRYELTDYTVSHFAKVLEEFLEMLGISLLWSLFLRRFARLSYSGLLLSFDTEKQG